MEIVDDALEEHITRGWKPISTSDVPDSSDNNDVVLCNDSPTKPSHLECISISSDDEGISLHLFSYKLISLINLTFLY